MAEKASEAGAPPQTPDPREFRAGDECDECEARIVAACLPCEFGGCAEHMREHEERCPEVEHHHGSDPWHDNCGACQRESWVFERERAETVERDLKREIERLQDAWFQDEGIAPDGELRPLASRTVNRAAALEALVARIHALTDPNAEPARSK